MGNLNFFNTKGTSRIHGVRRK